MQSLKELYKVGRGPSSSHTLAPERACRLFVQKFGTMAYYEADLYGSLSLTGKGHNTDRIIQETLPGKTKVSFHLDWKESFPNGFYLRGYNENHEKQAEWTVFSLGGGSIEIKEEQLPYNREIYPQKNYREVRQTLESRQISLPQFEYAMEPDLKPYLGTVLDAMLACVRNGLNQEGTLPGKLNLKRSARQLYQESEEAPAEEKRRLRLIAYAYAACEENASGHTCVTAPTLGACGVLASLMAYYAWDLKRSRDDLEDALAAGGLFGNLIKQNATISGAVGGCQAEVGAAVSMASAASAWLNHLNIDQVEYAAEIGMEHNLGLTCDPVEGYVMIPCIERNAMGITRAEDAALLAQYMSRIKHHLVSFDTVVSTMKDTGSQIPIALKETSIGGLAKEFEYDERK
jgi:L-serine dehydratase